MKKRVAILTLLPALLLSGCASFSGDNPAIRNGDLLFTLTDNPNMFRDINAKEIGYLLDAKSDFLFLVNQSGCSSCNEFKPVIEQYIKDTKQLVYRYDVKNEDFKPEFLPNYGERFFPDGLLETPSLFLISNEGNIEHLSKNMYSTTPMLTNMMKKHLYETNVYSFSRYYPFSEFVKSQSEFYTFMYNRSVAEQGVSYENYVHEAITRSEKVTAIIDVMSLSDSDKEKMLEDFRLTDFNSLTMHLVSNGVINEGRVVDSPIIL